MNSAQRARRLVGCSLAILACDGQPPSSSPALQGEATTTVSGGDAFVGNVPPAQDGNLWRFSYGPIVVEIDAANGASISTFSRNGANVLGAGSWFRPSPQNAWGWPPPPEVESMPYAASAAGNVVTFQGQPNTQWGLQAKRRIWANLERQVLTVEYTLTNVGMKPAKWAPWEISRVHPTGLTFFPEGSPITAKASSTQLPLTSVGGISWFDFGAQTLAPGKYIVARDGAEGWIAHVESGLLFVKTFPDVPVAQIAPDEGEIQLYTETPASKDSFLEVEDEGPYVSLGPGESTVWTVRWYLLDVPTGVTPTVGNPDLAAFVRSTIYHQGG